MNTPLRILNLEDNSSDADLVKFELEEAGFTPHVNVVSRKEEFIQALQEFKPDLILSDYDLPQYNGALALADAKRLCPEVPFILVTGAVSEDRAIEILTSGAKDYVMKNRISRLVPAIKRVLSEAKEHKARKKAEEELREAYRTLEEKVKIRTSDLESEILVRKRIEEAQRLNAAIMETVAEGIFLIGLNDNIIKWANLKFEELFGYAHGEMVGMHVDNVNAPTDKTPTENRIAIVDVLRKDGEWHGEVKNIKKDGTQFWSYIHVSLFNHPEFGKVMVSAHTDITELKRAEQVLNFEKKRLETVLETIPVAVVIAEESDNHFSLINRRARELYGFDTSSLMLKEHFEAVKPKKMDGSPYPYDELPVALALKGQTVLNKAMILERPDGTSYFINGGAAPILNSEGQISATVVVFDDITKQKKVEDTLKESEDNYRELVENANSNILRMDRNGIINFANDFAQKFFGYSQEEFIGMNVKKLSPLSEYNGQNLRKMPEMILKNPDDYVKNINENIKKNGERIWISWRNRAIKDADGNVVGNLAIGQDITDLKKSETKLRESEEQLSQRVEEVETLMKIAPVAIWTSYDPQCNNIVGNKTANSFYEAYEQENVSANINGVRKFYKNGVEIAGKELPMQVAAAKNKDVVNECLDVRLPSGKNIHMIGSARPLHDKNGEVRGCVGAFLDITEGVNSEEAFAIAHGQLQSIINNTPASIYVFDLEERFILANTAVAKLLNSTPEQMIGKRRHEFMPKEDADLHEANDRLVIESGKALEFEEYSQLNSRSITWLTTKFPLHDKHNKIYALAGISTDITERKSMEESIKTYSKKLEETNKELESFSYSVSHDLRAPLRAIDGYSRMILKRKRDEFDDETKRQFNQVRKSTKTMGRLIDDLLALSRSGMQDLIIKSLNLRRIFRKTWEGLQNDNQYRNMTLKINQSLPLGLGDEGLIQQVIINLLTNAVKFTKIRDAALIEVGGYERDKESVYYIKDNGVGFDMQYHDKLFGTFQRLHDANEYEGTGIGMALVKRIIHRHGGQVWAESEINKGATFYFTLPCQQGSE